MRHTAVVAGLIGVLLLASLSLLRQRGSVEEHANGDRPDAVPAATPDLPIERAAVTGQSDAAREATATDLRSASQTFRNSTLLFAIRRAGFYCGDVVSAHETTDDVWLASCSDMLGYVVTLRGAEQFDVHPVAHYFDSVAPVPVDRDRPLEPRLPDPQPLTK